MAYISRSPLPPLLVLIPEPGFRSSGFARAGVKNFGVWGFEVFGFLGFEVLDADFMLGETQNAAFARIWTTFRHLPNQSFATQALGLPRRQGSM